MDSIEALPLFPLSDVVLLPQVSVPLFIFEPRYRQMTREALDGARRIGMIAVRPNAVSRMQGEPAIFEIGCVGRITRAQERPDGTFQILLLGESRFRIRDEHPKMGPRLYRTAHVELLEDVGPATPAEIERLEATRGQVLDLLTRVVARAATQPSADQPLANLATLDPVRLINLLAQSISFDPIERQQLLEADSILTRFETMRDLLRFRLAEAGSLRPESGSLPN